MRSWQDMTLGDIGRALARYRPFIVAVATIVLVVAFLPGDDDGDKGGLETAEQAQSLEQAPGEPPPTTDSTVAATAGGAAGAAAGATGARTGASARTAGSGAVALPAEVGPDCDTVTGRIKVPSRYAPPCVAPFAGDNGGATAQGVTRDTITWVHYQLREDPATSAALTAANAQNSQPDQQETLRAYHDYFRAHYESYGRKVNLIVKEASGPTTDDAAAKADAIDIATRIKPFGVYGGIVGDAPASFVREIAARKIVCICGVSQPQEFYETRQPYVGYTPLMSSTQGYIHRAEYVGKRLARRPAKFAGDPLLAANERSFALVYFETADNAYRSGAQFFDRELREKYGVQLKEMLAYTGPPNFAQTQEHARAYISKLKETGVTSVIFAGDPISPAIFTQEATRQRYNPEWIVTGSALVDTTIFGRTYDQTQWSHAFGISFLTARVPKPFQDTYSLHVWHHGVPPKANNQYGVIYPMAFSLFTAVHMAGPNLTAQTFQQGLFNYPVSGAGSLTNTQYSFGRHGIWPMVDLTRNDDVTEVWWDPQEAGEDEVGNRGVGMYRYVDGGKRYLPGQHLTTDPKAFDKAGTVTIYAERPAADRAPQYEHKHYR